MAVSADGRILGFQSVIMRDGGLKAADWRLFLQLLIPKLDVYVPGHPWHLQASNCAVMIENAPTHTVRGNTLLAYNGVPFWRLPAYSPDLQPIESVFSDLKVIIRYLVYVQPDLSEHPHLLQARAASFIARRQVVGKFDLVDKVKICGAVPIDILLDQPIVVGKRCESAESPFHCRAPCAAGHCRGTRPARFRFCLSQRRSETGWGHG